MKKKWVMFLIICCMLSLSACSSKEEIIEEKVDIESLLENKTQLSGEEFQVVGEGDEMSLLLSPSNGIIRWQSKADGTYLDTKIFGENSNDRTKSDLIVTYYSGASVNKYSKTSSMDSFTMSVEMDTVYYEEIENGIRILYHFGDDKVSYLDFPAYIREDRMEELVLQYLSAAEKETIKSRFTLTKGGIYSRNANKDHPLTGMAAPELYRLFYEVGKYTFDELEADNAEFDQTELPTKQEIYLPIEYYLEENDLMVRVCADEMVSDVDFPIKSVEVLPYFLSTIDKDGYMFVPDGSGALVYLDNNKVSEYQFTNKYFGGDKLVGATNYDNSGTNLTLPVFGLKTSKYAVLGIIENGAQAATLNTYISGYYSNEEFSRLSLSFDVREEQTITASNSASYSMKKVTDDYFKEKFVLRYRFLSKEQADYVGMADSYSDYLVEKGVLKEKVVEDTAPFFVEVLGATDKTKHFAGVPYEGTQVLTTISQAKEILESLTNVGIQNVKMLYSGVLNGGLNQRSIEKVSVLSALGSKKELSNLSQYAESIGASLFPNVMLQTAYTKKGLSQSEMAYFISGDRAELYQFDTILRIPLTTTKYKRYIIHPNYIVNYANKFVKSYNKLGIENIATSDFLTFVGASYKKGEHISQTTALPKYLEALETISNDKKVMLSNPIVNAYSYADYLTDLPVSHSGLRTFDVAIPFLQLVLDGYMDYSMPVMNQYTADIEDDLLHAVETKSALKFRFTQSDGAAFENTEQDNYFMTEYNYWKDSIGDYYKRYAEFYNQVKDAKIVDHDIVDKNNDYRVVKYSNGITVYLNYSDENAVISSVPVNAHSFVVE